LAFVGGYVLANSVILSAQNLTVELQQKNKPRLEGAKQGCFFIVFENLFKK